MSVPFGLFTGPSRSTPACVVPRLVDSSGRKRRAAVAQSYPSQGSARQDGEMRSSPDASGHQKQLRHFKRLESYRNRLTLVLRYRCLCTTCFFFVVAVSKLPVIKAIDSIRCCVHHHRPNNPQPWRQTVHHLCSQILLSSGQFPIGQILAL